jgi:acetate kinase
VRRVLAVNCGSSTVKYLLADVPERGPLQRLDEGKAEGAPGLHPVHGVLERLRSNGLLGSVEAIGHRVVHGGSRFLAPTLVDDRVLEELERLSELAPLHNPPAVAAIAEARRVLGPGVAQVATFDTAFHARLPLRAAVYAVPLRWTRELGVRRYGFHGLAHRYLAERYAELRGADLAALRLVTLQLGSGCSAAAISGGWPVDTSMGLTPNEGLVMATRSGDVDPNVVEQVARATGRAREDVLGDLDTASGLLGVSGLTGDMRELLEWSERGHREAKAAVDLFCYRARKYLGAYLAVLGGADAVLLGGGIGESSPAIRSGILEGFGWLGLSLDPDANRAAVGVEARVSRPDSRIAVHVIPVDEQSVICRDTVEALA